MLEHMGGSEFTSRRDFSRKTLAAVTLGWPSRSGKAYGMPLLTDMGIASTSFMGARLRRGQGAEREHTIEFLERCHSLGASGIQTQIIGDPHRLRARAEQLGMWVEAMVSVRNSTPEQLEKAIVNAKEAGCTVARDGLLGGRRYETFASLQDWKAWMAESLARLKTAIPLFEKHKITLALENHKDWTSEQFVNLFQTHSSEYFGACLDFGNNLSLLDDLMTTIEAAAPYIKATHFKDMAVMPYADGFLLSEVPLGTGVLDLARAVRVVQKANPKVRFALEMITRDPLKVPCLTDRYWATFPDRNGIYLARTLRYVNQHKSTRPLPRPEELSHAEHARLEEDNIRQCFQYVQGKAARNSAI